MLNKKEKERVATSWWSGLDGLERKPANEDIRRTQAYVSGIKAVLRAIGGDDLVSEIKEMTGAEDKMLILEAGGKRIYREWEKMMGIR